ncbi:predicted protein [Histoplasma capsulatum G186AR]|uniref:Uncharacterized protein n=1 Tax=Ajellomyces capsulatus (strain G186AR / H82 / ATCC MYA-2454 / RMSCC 2432) TaxID=447093 RepID=C0NQ93_AJECG|nr:uncharacterized protein HCBG_05681 [Histoplasma capsulatum G186AR]EEH06365.1 predicted protein [Histoplasma capsulatum G186AR]
MGKPLGFRSNLIHKLDRFKQLSTLWGILRETALSIISVLNSAHKLRQLLGVILHLDRGIRSALAAAPAREDPRAPAVDKVVGSGAEKTDPPSRRLLFSRTP